MSRFFSALQFAVAVVLVGMAPLPSLEPDATAAAQSPAKGVPVGNVPAAGLCAAVDQRGAYAAPRQKAGPRARLRCIAQSDAVRPATSCDGEVEWPPES
jgi:hypothetical protein